MLRKLLLISVVVVNSCAVFSGTQHLSQWAQLDDVHTVSCDPWPVASNILDIDNFTVLKSNEQIGFLVESKLRDGSKNIQYQAFNGNTRLRLDGMKNVSFGSDSVPLAAGLAEEGRSLAIIHNRGNHGVTLKLHNIGSGVVSFESGSLGARVQGGEILPTGAGYWLILQHSPYQIAYIERKPVKGVLPVLLYPNLSLSSRPSLILGGEKSSAFLVELDKKPTADSNSSPSLTLRQISPTGEVTQPTPIAIPAQGGIETWAVNSKPGGLHLARVDGDSLVGQADLKIARLGINAGFPRVEWNKSISLKNMHLSQPVWASSRINQWVLLLKWVDGESTLAAYKIGSIGVEGTEHYGVFPKGTSLVDAFYSNINSELIAIIRNKTGVRWNYEICSLGSAN